LSTPPFNRAAMDGYAVKAKDTFDSGQFSPRVLELVGEIHAGGMPKQRVNAGQCIQIATGAMMPGGADAVVMVEDTEAENGRVKVFKPVYPKANVGKKGEDIKEGELVVKVTDSQWKKQLEAIKLKLREQVNNILGEELIKDISFVLRKR